MPFNYDDLSENGLDELRGLRKNLQDLVQAPVWRAYNAILEARARALLEEVVLRPLSSMDSVPAQEFRKGQYAQIDWDLNAPAVWIDELNREIERKAAAEAAQQQKDGQNERSSASPEFPISVKRSP